VNKADRGGAERVKAELEAMLHMSGVREAAWQTPVIITEAEQGKGVDELLRAIGRHRESLESTGMLSIRRQENRKLELVEIIEETVRNRLMQKSDSQGLFHQYVSKVKKGEMDPYSAAQEIFASEQLVREITTDK